MGGTNPCRRRGGQTGNQNAFRHGQQSQSAIVARKLSTARIKALSHVMQSWGPAPHERRYRISCLRRSQIVLLAELDPELLCLVPRQFLALGAEFDSD